ncbi:hypothetical protein [Burkholderia cenocepacia]|uniref:hypothetical protein n=1 Tax=Burkholderia cenocepacia TaxID=95486 RepID=UPI00158ED2C9|nr:hypothetical protein [Burkholderia cenocepacia]
MIRARFSVNRDDPRPVVWPIKHPYWVTGYGNDHATIVAYADDEAEIMRNWPDAHDFSFVDPADSYVFTDRFAKPAWFAGDTPEA